MPTLDQDTFKKISSHLLSFYNSVKLSLAIAHDEPLRVRARPLEPQWKPLYFLAEYDYHMPDNKFEILLDTSVFQVSAARIEFHKWRDLNNIILKGGEIKVPWKSDGSLIKFDIPWQQSQVVFATGFETRVGWNRSWPHIQIDFRSPSNVISNDVWARIANAVVAHRVHYASLSEAVGDVLKVKVERLEFESNHISHGAILLPILASFKSVHYSRTGRELNVITRVKHHHEISSTILFASARVESQGQPIERMPKTPLTASEANFDKELSQSEWQSPIKSSAALIRRTNLYLIYDMPDYGPLLVDQEILGSVPALISPPEVEKLMLDKNGRRGLDSFGKIEKKLLEGKGEDFEEAMVMVLSRAGFDVSWQGRNSPFDILAASPNGCLVVECTSDTPSTAMAKELKELAQGIRSNNIPKVLPVLATNQTLSNELDQDLIRMHENSEVCLLTRDRIRQFFEEIKFESLDRTEKYLRTRFQG